MSASSNPFLSRPGRQTANAYCGQCGGRIRQTVPPGDSRLRSVCEACGAIQYDNPKLVVGCIPQWGDRVLLCRRAIEPRYGYWTLPAGFMENGESTAEGAARETLEEAGARVEELEPFSLLDVPPVNQIHLYYRARLCDTAFANGDETLESRLFAESEIPWEMLSFRTVTETLRLYFADRAAGRFGFHQKTLSAPPVPREK